MSNRLVDPRARAQAAHGREVGLRRLRRLTFALVAGAAALTGAFAGIGAASVPGRKPTRAAVPKHRRVTVTSTTRARPAEVPAPTPPLPVSSAGEVPAPPAAAPVASAAAPVVVSGGS